MNINKKQKHNSNKHTNAVNYKHTTKRRNKIQTKEKITSEERNKAQIISAIQQESIQPAFNTTNHQRRISLASLKELPIIMLHKFIESAHFSSFWRSWLMLDLMRPVTLITSRRIPCITRKPREVSQLICFLMIPIRGRNCLRSLRRYLKLINRMELYLR